MRLTAETFLSTYLEKTLIIKSAIEVNDLEIIMNTLTERDELIGQWEESGLEFEALEHRELIEEIQRYDRINNSEMLKFNEKLKQLETENNQNIQRLEKGKNASNKYNSPYSDSGGSYFDTKR